MSDQPTRGRRPAQATVVRQFRLSPADDGILTEIQHARGDRTTVAQQQ